MSLSIFAALLLPLKLSALALPGYLAPNHPAPTGHFKYESLAEHTLAYDEFEWLWISDGKGHQGWVLKSDVMLPLDFSRKAQLLNNHVIYQTPSFREKTRSRLSQPQLVNLLDREREWFKVEYLVNQKNHRGWVRDEHLRSSTRDAGFFISRKDTPIRAQRDKQSKIVGHAAAGEKLLPVKISGDWALIKSGKISGYVPLTMVKTRLDVAVKIRTAMGYQEPHRRFLGQRIFEIFSHPVWLGTGDYTLDVKAKPDTGSDTVITLQPWSDLILQGYARQRWGLSEVPQLGRIWWPAEFTEANVKVPLAFSAPKYRIAQRSILQEVVSPTIKGLKFVATDRGVFKSTDGEYWHQLPDFDRGYPINVDPRGTVFVGDKVSFDHGTTFHEFIRWDKVLAQLPINTNFSHSPIRIVNIEPEANDLNRITLDITVGYYDKFKLHTNDFGKNWSLL